jgi:hypothetical protein
VSGPPIAAGAGTGGPDKPGHEDEGVAQCLFPVTVKPLWFTPHDRLSGLTDVVLRKALILRE